MELGDNEEDTTWVLVQEFIDTVTLAEAATSSEEDADTGTQVEENIQAWMQAETATLAARVTSREVPSAPLLGEPPPLHGHASPGADAAGVARPAAPAPVAKPSGTLKDVRQTSWRHSPTVSSEPAATPLEVGGSRPSNPVTKESEPGTLPGSNTAAGNLAAPQRSVRAMGVARPLPEVPPPPPLAAPEIPLGAPSPKSVVLSLRAELELEAPQVFKRQACGVAAPATGASGGTTAGLATRELEGEIGEVLRGFNSSGAAPSVFAGPAGRALRPRLQAVQMRQKARQVYTLRARVEEARRAHQVADAAENAVLGDLARARLDALLLLDRDTLVLERLAAEEERGGLLEAEHRAAMAKLDQVEMELLHRSIDLQAEGRQSRTALPLRATIRHLPLMATLRAAGRTSPIA